jgi:endonuclease-8
VQRRLGPDILASPPDFDAMLVNLRALPPRTPLGAALQHQRSVAGIGNMWMNECVFDAGVSPWLTLAETTDDELRASLRSAARMMRGRLDGGARGNHRVYRRTNRPCPRCGELVRSFPLGDDARMAYWCPGCQRGKGPDTQ